MLRLLAGKTTWNDRPACEAGTLTCVRYQSRWANTRSARSFLVTGNFDGCPERAFREIGDRCRHLAGKLLVMAADFPQAGQLHALTPRPRTPPRASLKTCRAASSSFSVRHSSSGLCGPCGRNSPGRNADGVQGENHPLVLALRVLIPREANLQRVRARRQIDVRQLAARLLRRRSSIPSSRWSVRRARPWSMPRHRSATGKARANSKPTRAHTCWRPPLVKRKG